MQKVVTYLDRFLNLAARIVILFALLAVVVGICQLTIFLWLDPKETRAAKVLELLHSNWRALIVVAVPLFYPAIRIFLEEVEDLFGIKRRKSRGDDALSKDDSNI